VVIAHPPSPENPSLHPLSDLNLHLEVFPHLVLILFRESRIIACMTLAGAEDVLVRGCAPFPFPASTNTAAVEPFRAVGQGAGPFTNNCPDVGTFELDERFAQVACVVDVLIEGAVKLLVTEDLVHVLLRVTVSDGSRTREDKPHTMSIDIRWY